MKKLFLFALSAMMICGCSDEKVSTFNGVNCYPSQEINFDFLGGRTNLLTFTLTLTLFLKEKSFHGI